MKKCTKNCLTLRTRGNNPPLFAYELQNSDATVSFTESIELPAYE